MPRSKSSDPETYTKPERRDKIKKKIIAGDKGGNPGQWSARKAQLLTHEYEREGGGYKHSPNEAQKSLREWGDEHSQTSDKKPARPPGGATASARKKAAKKTAKKTAAQARRSK